MNPVTNQEVKDALDSCIKDKWEPIVADPKHYDPECDLCDVQSRMYKSTGIGNCKGCPIVEYNPKERCGSKGSTYSQWDSKPSVENAQSMLDLLLKVRQHFFGDWK